MSDQLDLLTDGTTAAEQVLAPNPGRVHRHGLTTERKAAERASFRSGSQTAKLLIELDRRGEAIPHDIFQAAGCAYPNIATTRLGLLKDLGLVERLTEKGPTPSGGESHVWRITDEGRKVAAQVAA